MYIKPSAGIGRQYKSFFSNLYVYILIRVLEEVDSASLSFADF